MVTGILKPSYNENDYMKIKEIDHESVNYAPCKNTSIHCAVTVFLWQYRLWSFQERDTELERFLAKKQLYSNEITKF